MHFYRPKAPTRNTQGGDPRGMTPGTKAGRCEGAPPIKQPRPVSPYEVRVRAGQQEKERRGCGARALCVRGHEPASTYSHAVDPDVSRPSCR